MAKRESLGSYLRELIEGSEYGTQKEFAEAVGLHPTYFSRLLNGYHDTCRYSTLRRISNVLNLNAEGEEKLYRLAGQVLMAPRNGEEIERTFRRVLEEYNLIPKGSMPEDSLPEDPAARQPFMGAADAFFRLLGNDELPPEEKADIAEGMKAYLEWRESVSLAKGTGRPIDDPWRPSIVKPMGKTG